ncbi:RNA-guided endonuclease IscB [Mastigocladopsis repens]|uniref:RNA-guided endonuclease IscB n=1 Tax=Mastigocladopsis repens TaxID=221287 RepID=UPI00031ACF20|nr:RNA-guided endonuclease IscB [Mastigocladopsis repens]
MQVFVLDQQKQPLDPCHPKRARQLLKSGRAAIFKRYPFTIILKDRKLENSTISNHRLKIDPGSRITGLAIVQEQTGRVVFASHLTHRGFQIREALLARRQIRRSRRNRKTRYRKAKFLNRRRSKGWLSPSLNSRVENIITWVNRLRKSCPTTALSQELVKFDTQLIQNSSIQSVEYQQGTRAGYEVREYLLQKWNYKCAYCQAENTPLQIEHILAKSKGGSNRISNLTIACERCNIKKGNKPVEEFLKRKPELLKQILSQSKKPLVDAAVVNTTRWELFRRLQAIGLPVETGSGGLTKYNRTTRDLEKAHWIDSCNVGISTPEKLLLKGVKPILIKATGHGTRQIARTNKYGFPNRYCPRNKFHFGFQTGDIARAVVTKGKKIGIYIGRVATRSSGSFNISTKNGLVQGISHQYCQIVQKKDGYGYS